MLDWGLINVVERSSLAAYRIVYSRWGHASVVAKSYENELPMKCPS